MTHVRPRILFYADDPEWTKDRTMRAFAAARAGEPVVHADGSFTVFGCPGRFRLTITSVLPLRSLPHPGWVWGVYEELE